MAQDAGDEFFRALLNMRFPGTEDEEREAEREEAAREAGSGVANPEEPSPEPSPCAYRDARGYEPVTDAQREANRSGWAYDDRTRRGGVANPFPQTPKARGIAPNIVIPSPSAAPGSSWDLL